MTSRDSDRLSNGKLARLDIGSAARTEAALALLETIRADGIETIRVLFADAHGVLRGKTLVAEQAVAALADGITVPSTLLLKDTSGRTVFPVWSEDSGVASGPLRGAGDVVLAPDPATYRRLPWSPHSAWLMCDVFFATGAPVPFAPRGLLQRHVARLADAGFEMVAGLEVEFHVFAREPGPLAHSDTTMPPRPPATSALAPGFQLLSELQYDRLEPVMDVLRRAAVGIGLPVTSTEVEMGPSQFEFTFAPDAPMAQADNLVMFRTLVKEVAAREGLHATFMCRPRVENAASSGWHLHQSLVGQDGISAFMPEHNEPTAVAGQWIAGLLAHARENCLLTTPTVNGYKRYRPFQLAPDRIAWGIDNRGAMIRALFAPGDTASRIENRIAEPAANPYFVFAGQIAAGLSGVANGLVPPPPTETPYASDGGTLPATLGEAIDAFDCSPMFREAFGAEVVDYLAQLKLAEWERYLGALSEWEQAEYFGVF